MLRSQIARALILLVLCICLAPGSSQAQVDSQAGKRDGAQLKFVVYLSRHGVRSPTWKPGRYDRFSATAWPQWDVPPGYLTPHGFELMKLFGAYDRSFLADEGLLTRTGCSDAGQIDIVADSDQRTRETGKALAKGMFPGCAVPVHALPENDPDPLFHAMRTNLGKAIPDQRQAMNDGRDPAKFQVDPAADGPQLRELDRILAGCGRTPVTNAKRTSVLDLPTKQRDLMDSHGAGGGDALKIASSMAETLLLEYAEAMKGADLGWGCLDEGQVRQIMQLHTAHTELTDRTSITAHAKASNLLEHILLALQQSATGKAITGGLGKPGDQALFLVGHDTNIATVAALLDLHWTIDGRRDDTPPGGSLIFELWRSAKVGWFVRLYYTAQTLSQMRESTALTLTNPPQRVSLPVPECSGQDMSCPLDSFAAMVQRVVDPAYVKFHSAERASMPND